MEHNNQIKRKDEDTDFKKKDEKMKVLEVEIEKLQEYFIVGQII